MSCFKTSYFVLPLWFSIQCVRYTGPGAVFASNYAMSQHKWKPVIWLLSQMSSVVAYCTLIDKLHTGKFPGNRIPSGLQIVSVYYRLHDIPQMHSVYYIFAKPVHVSSIECSFINSLSLFSPFSFVLSIMLLTSCQRIWIIWDIFRTIKSVERLQYTI